MIPLTKLPSFRFRPVAVCKTSAWRRPFWNSRIPALFQIRWGQTSWSYIGSTCLVSEKHTQHDRVQDGQQFGETGKTIGASQFEISVQLLSPVHLLSYLRIYYDIIILNYLHRYGSMIRILIIRGKSSLSGRPVLVRSWPVLYLWISKLFRCWQMGKLAWLERIWTRYHKELHFLRIKLWTDRLWVTKWSPRTAPWSWGQPLQREPGPEDIFETIASFLSQLS